MLSMLRRSPACACVLWVLSLCPGFAAEQFDVLIKGGRVIDGSGAPWMYNDVGIVGDRIVAVGKLSGTAKQVVDATGLYVVPGFIDPHSHAWPAISQPKTAGAQALLTQGITTIFLNPDGGGPTDLAKQREAVLAQRPGVNVAQMIGHNSVRSEVIGSRDVTPDAGQLSRMAALVRRGFEAGAFGLSAGPFYVPGTYSKTEEHIALARIAAEFDGFYSSHIRDEADYNVGVVAAVDEVIRIAREARLPGIVTHIKVLGPRAWGHSAEIIRRIDAARAEGVEVFADQYPYEASSTGLTAALVPAWAQEGGAGALQGRLANAELRARIRREMTENLARRAGASNILIRSYRANPSLEGRRLDAIARDRLMEPVDAALEIIAGGSASIVSFNMQEDDIRAFMVQPWTMTCTDGQLVLPGDGVPHPRAYGPFPRKLRRYVVEQSALPLERAVHSMTGLTAGVLRLRDRGVIRPGAFADVVVFDLSVVRDRATYENPHQFSEGILHVYVNGGAALTGGKVVDARHGRALVRARK